MRARTSSSTDNQLVSNVLAVLGGSLVTAVPLLGQAEVLPLAPHADFVAAEAPTVLERGRYTVLIDLDENRLYFKQGDVVLWSAPVGTGTGVRLITDAERWDFSTPRGRYQVEFKERNPVWIAPDWYFLENGLPVPSPNHPSRYMAGTLGVAAVYISPTLAIHGTDRPELIGQRVSHGCIRLENRYAQRLFHNVQVGTEVIIEGGDEVRDTARVIDLREGYDASLRSRGIRLPAPRDPVMEGWKGLPTDQLLRVLDQQLSGHMRTSRWDEVAILLSARARAADDLALAGLLNRSAHLPSTAIEREWATFMAELFRDAPVRTLVAMSALGNDERREIAELIVSAVVSLYSGDLNSPVVPWPSGRIPRGSATQEGEPGWDALAAAEREMRGLIRGAATDI
jgi:hypothetical protein